MYLDLAKFNLKNKTVAIALSGGADSMALLYSMREASKNFGFNIVALNVEHGIRGENSISDTEFVKNHCQLIGVPVICYSVDSLKKAKDENLSVEQAARLLRYGCFNDAISSGKCDVVATAHHQSDNVESILFNLFRGTGLKGLTGITPDFLGKIIRPLLGVTKSQIDEYVKVNSIPFVIDETNLSADYTRNFLRLNVIPIIKEAFPEMENSVLRLSEIVSSTEDYLQLEAQNVLSFVDGDARLPAALHPAVLSRAIILALKALGLEKDWEKTHVDGVLSLKTLNTGAVISLPKGIYAIREYDKIIISSKPAFYATEAQFALGKTVFGNDAVFIEKVTPPINLKDGLYADLDKIPNTAVIRSRKDGDVFTKFGGGSKKLNDFLTDKKIPLRTRDVIPLLADGNQVLCVFGVAVSNLIRVDESTKTIIKFSKD